MHILSNQGSYRGSRARYGKALPGKAFGEDDFPVQLLLKPYLKEMAVPGKSALHASTIKL